MTGHGEIFRARVTFDEPLYCSAKYPQVSVFQTIPYIGKGAKASIKPSVRALLRVDVLDGDAAWRHSGDVVAVDAHLAGAVEGTVVRPGETDVVEDDAR